MDVDHEDESVDVIEMFVDDVSGIGLWGEEDDLEDDLPMPDYLRQRIKAWIDEYTATISDPVVRRRWTMADEVEHDVRGYEMSPRATASARTERPHRLQVSHPMRDRG
jgi:hypothetical protein